MFHGMGYVLEAIGLVAAAIAVGGGIVLIVLTVPAYMVERWLNRSEMMEFVPPVALVLAINAWRDVRGAFRPPNGLHARQRLGRARAVRFVPTGIRLAVAARRQPQSVPVK